MRVVQAHILVHLLAALAVLGLSATATADEFELKNGEKFEAEVIEKTDDLVIVDHPVFGRLEIPLDAIKVEEETPIHPGLFGSPVLRGWKRLLGLGFSGAQGNSQSAAFSSTLRVARNTESYRGLFDAAYFFGAQQGTTNTNEFFGSYKHDFLFKDSRWFLWGQGRYDYDEFQDFLHRVTGQGGLGYDFIEHDKFDLRGNAGIGVAKTWGTEDEVRPEGVFGLIFVWNVIEGQTLNADTTYFPNFTDNPEFRLLSNINYEIALGLLEGLSLNFGMKNEYRSKVLSGKKNNLKYLGNLVYDF